MTANVRCKFDVSKSKYHNFGTSNLHGT